MSGYLIVGASGTVGSEIVKLLKQQGQPVRATTGKKTATKIADGVDTVHVDLATGQGINAAFDGVDRAFFLSPAGYADQYRVLAPLIQEAKRRKLKKVVLMSAFGANAVETAPLRRAEIELERSGVPYNIIRPNWFLQNFNTFWIQAIKQQGKILLPAGAAKVSFIDARDIAAVAVKLLTSDDLNNRAFDLTGPEAVDHAEVAKVISSVAGRKVTYENIEAGELKKGLLAAGLPQDYTDFLLVIFGFLKEGYNAKLTNEVQAILGRAPTGLKKYAQDYKQAWV